MVRASFRYSDTKVAYKLWETRTAICGRPRDIKRKGRPLITWGAPLSGINSIGDCDGPILSSLSKFPPCVGEGVAPFSLSFPTNGMSIPLGLRPIVNLYGLSATCAARLVMCPRNGQYIPRGTVPDLREPVGLGRSGSAQYWALGRPIPDAGPV